MRKLAMLLIVIIILSVKAVNAEEIPEYTVDINGSRAGITEIIEEQDKEITRHYQDSTVDQSEWNEKLEDIINTGESFIIEGDGLTPVREYKIDGTEYEIIFTDDVAINSIIVDLPPDINLIPIVLKRKYEQTLVYFDSNFDIANMMQGLERDELSIIGNNGFYVKSSDCPIGEGRGPSYYRRHEFCNISDGVISTIDFTGNVSSSNTNNSFMIVPLGNEATLLGEFGSRDGNVSYINDPTRFALVSIPNGDFTEKETSIPIYTECSLFNNDKNWIIAADVPSVDRDENPDQPRGTRILDESGNLQFTLNPLVYIIMLGRSNSSKVFYASDSYICQVGTKSELSIRDYYSGESGECDREQHDPFGSSILEVYDGTGNLIWDYDSGYLCESGTRLFVSANEKYIIYTNSGRNELLTFDLQTGELVYQPIVISSGRIKSGFVSDDGSISAVVSETHGTFSTLCVVKNGSVISEIKSLYDYSGKSLFTSQITAST